MIEYNQPSTLSHCYDTKHKARTQQTSENIDQEHYSTNLRYYFCHILSSKNLFLQEKRINFHKFLVTKILRELQDFFDGLASVVFLPNHHHKSYFFAKKREQEKITVMQRIELGITTFILS